MKKTNKFSKIILFSLIPFVGFAFASNCRGHHSFEKRVEWIAGKLTSKLDLDTAQKAKLESLKTELIAKHKEMKPKRDAWMTEVISQIRKDSVDTKVLDQIGTDQDTRHVEMRKFFQTKMVEFHSVLRSEQRQKLADLVEKFSKKHNPED